MTTQPMTLDECYDHLEAAIRSGQSTTACALLGALRRVTAPYLLAVLFDDQFAMEVTLQDLVDEIRERLPEGHSLRQTFQDGYDIGYQCGLDEARRQAGVELGQDEDEDEEEL